MYKICPRTEDSALSHLIYPHFWEPFNLFHRAWEICFENTVCFNGAKY